MAKECRVSLALLFWFKGTRGKTTTCLYLSQVTSLHAVFELNKIFFRLKDPSYDLTQFFFSLHYVINDFYFPIGSWNLVIGSV